MRKNIDFLHIYAGTRGASGLYLDKIYSALEHKYNQEVIVSAFYSFDYGKKWFYKYSDISSLQSPVLRVDIVRKMLRFIELIITLIRVFFYVKFNKVKFINYGLTSDLLVELIFIKLLKYRSNIKVIITCHDVLPFGSDDKDVLAKKIRRKKRFLNISHYLLVHNDNSIDDLKTYYNISNSNVFKINFPIMNLNDLKINHRQVNLSIPKDKFTIGMIGNLRREKGVDLLIEAWEHFYKYNKKVQLVIAGYVSPNIDYGFQKLENKSLIYYDKFVDDSEFRSLIQMCDVIVLPYKRGTNSGIPSQIISSGTLVIASDIDMFCQNKLISEEFLFQSNDFNALSEKLEWISTISKETIAQYKKDQYDKLLQYDSHFIKNVQNEFDKIYLEY